MRRLAAFLNAHAGKFVVAAFFLGWWLVFVWLWSRGFLHP